MIGQTVSHYKILEKLGGGGMGVVYKAQDLKLDRFVALKFLPPHLGADEEEKKRFSHEAKAASALDHLNICNIHEIDETEDGQIFICMAYYEGETLKKKVGSGQLSVNSAIDIAIQIAQGLAKAHEHGITHRDLKPANVMVTKEGVAKIVDFGLAKLAGQTRLTKSGMTLGTVAYMSTEQALGKTVDHRTDIWSFGAVLYEMITGQLPFKGEYDQAVMYSIMNEEPEPITSLRSNAPMELERIVKKCLQKDAAERYQDVQDLLVDLKQLKKQSESGIQGKVAQRVSESQAPWKVIINKQGLIIAGLAVVLILISVVIYLVLERPTPEAAKPESKLSKISFDPGLEDEPAWSPDGRFIAYTTDERGNFDIVVLPLAGGQPIRVADSPADDAQSAWSPDGSRLAFVSAREKTGRLSIMTGMGTLTPYLNAKGGDIFVIPAFGGTAVRLAEDAYYPAWSPDSKHIAFQAIRNGQWDLWIIPATGGNPTYLTNDPVGEFHPSWSPDGRWIAYATLDNLYVVSLTGGEPRKVLKQGVPVVRPAWTPDGKSILFSSTISGAMNIWKVAVQPDKQIPQDPVRVTLGQGNDVNVAVRVDGKQIAFSTVRNTYDIWELTVASQTLRQVTFETTNEDYPHLSPDGSRLLVTSDRAGRQVIWMMDLKGKALSQLIAEPGVGFARWAPSGKQIAAWIIRPKRFSLVIQNLGDLSFTELIIDTISGIGTPAWSPDGERIAFARGTNGSTNLWIYSFKSKELTQVTFLESSNNFPTWSPDGQLIAFQRQDESGRDIWVVPTAGHAPTQVTFGSSEDSHPQWSPRDKDVILFLRDHKNLCLVSLKTGKVKQITDFVEANVILDYPSWSFDGSKIYFSLAKKVGDIYLLENY